jgi:hypothetical protein
MLPIYGALHFIPAVLFKRKRFIQDPGKMLLKATIGSMRSSAFLGVFVVIYQSAHFSNLILLELNKITPCSDLLLQAPTP